MLKRLLIVNVTINLNHNSYTIVDAKISSTLPSQLFGL